MRRGADRPEASDALFDLSPRAMAVRFGAVVLARIRSGRDCRESARLAFSYAEAAIIEEHRPAVLNFWLGNGASRHE